MSLHHPSEISFLLLNFVDLFCGYHCMQGGMNIAALLLYMCVQLKQIAVDSSNLNLMSGIVRM